MGMIQTSHAEMEALFEKMMPHFLDYLKAHGTPVDRIELATTLHGITSLPARMDTGGVVKTVLAPLHLLSDVAEEAAQECRDATQDCREATADSRQATSDCRDATSESTDATQKAKDATAATLAARDAIEANERTRQTNELTRQANEQARKNAETQRGTAESQRISQESSRQTAEQSRKDAESARVTEHNALKEASQNATAGAVKAKEDCDEATAKATQATADLTQIKAEVDASKEAADKATTDTLAAKEAIERNEAERQANEDIRKTKETERQEAEQSRAEAEGARVTEHNALKTASENATAGAVKAKEDADNARIDLEQIKEATEEATEKANTATTGTLAAKEAIELHEAERQAAELVRQNNEQERQTAEQERTAALDAHLDECSGKVNKLITDTNATVSEAISDMESDIDTAKDSLTSTVNSAVAQAQSDIASEVTKAQNAAKSAADAAASASSQALRAKAHADNPPKIGENGNWHVYSETVGGYVDSGIKAKVETGDWATKAWVGQQGFLTSHQDISGKADKAALDALSTKLDDFLTGTDTDSVINKWKELEAFLAGYSESNTLAGLLSGKADKNHTHDYSGVYAAKSHNHDSVYAKIADIPSLSGYATQQWVNQQGFLKSHQSLSDYLKKTDAASLYQPKGNYAASSHSHNYAGSGSAGGDASYADALDVYSNISDYNANLQRNGLFSVAGSPSNGPGHGYGSLLQLSNVKNPAPGSSQHWISQLSFPTNNRMYYRTRVNNGAWNAWSTIAFTSDLTWDNISGKPSSFTPAAHSHAVADVTGLQDALNGKAASSHSHSYLPLAGGEMSGTINFAKLTGANGRTLIQQIMADNDYFRIFVGATASNAGYAEIATADEGNEPIYVRQYTGAFTTLKRTLTLLDASGNTVCPGKVTATGFAKSGSSDSYLLLGGGGHKAVSDFAVSGHTHDYAASNHTHNYAAASHTHTSGNISDLVKKTAVGDIGWGVTADQQKALAMSAIAFWNGAYSGNASNLAYCAKGAFGTIVTKGADDYALANHTHSYAASNHTHDYSGSFAPKGFSDFYEGQNTVSTLASVPVTKRTVVATISANASFSLSGSPSQGREVHVIVKNSGSADITVAIPTAYHITGGEDTLTIPGGGYGEINVLSTSAGLFVRMAT